MSNLPSFHWPFADFHEVENWNILKITEKFEIRKIINWSFSNGKIYANKYLFCSNFLIDFDGSQR